MQRLTELSIKSKLSGITKDNRPILEVTTITQEADIMVEEDIIIKVDTKIILQEDDDVGYVIKITISV